MVGRRVERFRTSADTLDPAPRAVIYDCVHGIVVANGFATALPQVLVLRRDIVALFSSEHDPRTEDMLGFLQLGVVLVERDGFGEVDGLSLLAFTHASTLAQGLLERKVLASVLQQHAVAEAIRLSLVGYDAIGLHHPRLVPRDSTGIQLRLDSVKDFLGRCHFRSLHRYPSSIWQRVP